MMNVTKAFLLIILLAGCSNTPQSSEKPRKWNLILLDGDSTNILAEQLWSQADRAILADPRFYDCVIRGDTGSSWSLQEGSNIVTYQSRDWDWTNMTLMIHKTLKEGTMVHVSESDFRPPLTTPYDSIPKNRDDYLKGYAYGVREQLRQLKTGQRIMGDRIPPNDDQKPYADGERDGQLAVLTKPDLISESVSIEEENIKRSQQEAGVVREPRGGSRAPQP
jgi:hypothetical protein